MNLPDDFAASMRGLMGNDEYMLLEKALDGEPVVSVRLNETKSAAVSVLPVSGGAQRVAWSRAGYYLKSRPRFTFDPLMHAGIYYVEEPSSMFVEQAFMQAAAATPVRRVLDLCAAPGGKSTLLRSLMPEGTLLVANEPIARRAAVLAENMQKWGNPDVAVTCNFPEAFGRMENYFDIIAADVPCSGEGMFRKDMQAREEWSVKAVESCAERQRQIINDVWPSLRPGGFLIYSTCTFNRSEDEDNVQWIARTLGAQIVPVSTEQEWGVTGNTVDGSDDVCHFFPHRARGEGFFLTLLRKNGECGETNVQQPAGRVGAGDFAGGVQFADRLLHSGDFAFCKIGAAVYARRRTLCNDMALLDKNFDVVFAGIPVAEEKEAKRAAKNSGHKAGKGAATAEYVPLQGLALSTELNRGAFEEENVDYADAVRYLRGETLTPSRQYARGCVLVTYRGVPLGFANNVGTRLNNLYPQAWRIKSTYVPAEPPELEF